MGGARAAMCHPLASVPLIGEISKFVFAIADAESNMGNVDCRMAGWVVALGGCVSLMGVIHY